VTANDDTADLLRESAAEFLNERHEFGAHKLGEAASPEFPADLWRELAQLGWLGLGLPEACGGPGFGIREASVLSEEFGRVASHLPYVGASVLPAALLEHCRRLDELAPMLASGERPFAVAWQEQLRHRAEDAVQTRFEDGYVSGRKHFVVAAAADSVLLVSAVRGADLVWAAVDARSPQVRLEACAAGAHSVWTVHFDRAPVMFDEPLAAGVAAQSALTRLLQAGRLAVGAQLVGVASALLDKTLTYVNGRVQFGQPIASFQSIRHRCVDQYIATRLARATLNHALRCFETAPQSSMAEAAISAAKARCGDVAVQIGREAVQMHGAMGFTEEGGVGAFLRSALQLRAWLGTPLEQRRKFAAHRAASEVACVAV